MTRPICINVGCERPCDFSATYKNGAKRWRPVCYKCHKASYGSQPLEEGVQFTKKDYCENRDGSINGYECTAYIPYSGALEMDHIEGDRENNVLENIQTLCKICHSYKSHKNKDFHKNRPNAVN